MLKAIRNLIEKLIKFLSRDKEKEEDFITVEEMIPRETKIKLYEMVGHNYE